MHRIAEQIAAGAVERGPENAARRIEQQKAAPAHTVGAGQEGGPRAQDGDKAPEEHDLAAVTRKEILAELQAPSVQVDDVAEAAQQAIAALAPDEEAHVVAEDGARSRRGDDEREGKVGCRAGV